MPQNPTPAAAGDTNPTTPGRETKTPEQLVVELLATSQSMRHGVVDAHRLLRRLRADWRAEDGDMLNAIHPSRAKVLTEEADEIVAYCPEHSDNENTWLVCHCPVADEMRRRARTLSSAPLQREAGVL
ncbi:hypothetical protein [Streptomyces sp. SR-10]|uniref:hypothetical protein n=1 Tax=Streptomyces sp. SR-10 TaxID=3416442 RepID=UPI003CFBA3B7